jgi:hypothetical protein
MVVTGGPTSITVTFAEKIAGDSYTVHVSGGPTAVSDFTVTLNSSGSATATIPPSGTSSDLQAGTYDVTVTRSGGTLTDFPGIVVGMGGMQPH